MISTKLQEKLNAASMRLANAIGNERMHTRDINYHDEQASRIRKLRQAERSKIDRAKATINRLSEQLENDL